MLKVFRSISLPADFYPRPVVMLGAAAFFIAGAVVEIESIYTRTGKSAFLVLAFEVALVVGVLRLKDHVSRKAATFLLLASLGLFMAVVTQSSDWADTYWAGRADYLTGR